MGPAKGLRATLKWFFESQSTKAFYAGIAIAAIALALDFAVPAVIYDNHPPFVIWHTVVLTPELNADTDSQFRFEYNYSKRKECHPPLGKGEGQYRLWRFDGTGFTTFVELPQRQVSIASPEQNFRATSVNIPASYIEEPGEYAVQYLAMHTCKGASVNPIFTDGPMMPVKVK